MRTKLILSFLLLLSAIGGVLWHAREEWHQDEARRRRDLDVTVKSAPAPPLAPAPKPQAPPAANYADVAMKNLFSKDRNPTVAIDPPKADPPKPPPVMPHLPVVYGVLPLPSGTKAIMAEKPGDQSKAVRAGDSVGEFRLVALDSQKATFEWQDKKIERSIDELIDHAALPPATPAAGPNIAPAGVAAGQVPQPAMNAAAAGSPLGTEVGAEGHSERACKPDDKLPEGTVREGYRKVLTPTPFGVRCRWLPAQ